jgi:hypothetical protein
VMCDQTSDALITRHPSLITLHGSLSSRSRTLN